MPDDLPFVCEEARRSTEFEGDEWQEGLSKPGKDLE